MSPELEDKLAKEFAHLFERVRKRPNSELQYVGCACDDGWFNLVYRLCSRLDYHTNMPDYKGAPVKIECVKEKFGMLRIYVSGGDDYVHAARDMIEELSACTCEITGKPGELHRKPSGWIKTLCAEEAAKLEATPYSWPRRDSLGQP